MSNYFDALMQSSGLSADGEAALRLDTAGQVTPSPTDYGIVEVDEQISVVPSESSRNRTMPLGPMQNQTDLAIGGESARPSIEPAPTLSFIEKAVPVTVASMSEAYTTSLPESPAVHEHAANDEVSLRGNQSSLLSSSDSLVSGPVLVQAALRWIASDKSPAPVVPKSASMVSPELGSSVVPKEVQAHGRGEESAGNRVIEERLELSAPSSSGPPLRTHAERVPDALHDSAQHRRIQNHDTTSENVVEVTIGSINVRVDAPPQPTAAVTAPSPAPGTFPQSSSRSGFSRRTLWRL